MTLRLAPRVASGVCDIARTADVGIDHSISVHYRQSLLGRQRARLEGMKGRSSSTGVGEALERCRTGVVAEIHHVWAIGIGRRKT